MSPLFYAVGASGLHLHPQVRCVCSILLIAPYAASFRKQIDMLHIHHARQVEQEHKLSQGNALHLYR